MSFVVPAALGLTALTIPIVLLYMLRSRRARTPVSSTLLWDLGAQNVSASAPWQPLRFSLLLLLQLLALLLVVLAIARPARPTSLPLAEHTVLILDTSASMQADDGGRSRLESARRQALSAVGQLGARRMSVIEAGPRARVLLSGSSDRRALVDAISSVRQSDGVTDAGGAFALGQSLETADVPTIMHFYSDGGVRPEDRAEAPGTLVHVPIGRQAGNVAIARLAAAPKGAGWDVFVRLRNNGTVRVDGAITLEASGTRLAREAIRLDPQSGKDLTLALPRTTATTVVARLENLRVSSGTVGDASLAQIDALRTDDTAYAVLDPGASLRVLLVTKGNVFLESLLKSFPGAQVSVAETATPARGYSLAIYDRVAPPRTLEAPSLVIDAPGGAPGVRVQGSIKRPIVTSVQPREPIVQQVDLSRLAIRVAQRVRAPELRALVSAGDDPLLAVGGDGGRRLAYLSFDLRESNLPVQVAYPLLFGNLITWLTQGEGPDRSSLVAGDRLPLRVPGRADRLTIATPAGATLERAAVSASFDETDHAGFYRVRAYAGKDLIGDETFAVNVPTLEQNLVAKPITGALADRGRGGLRLSGLRSWGPGIVAIALAVLMLEWWIAHGRPTRRRARATTAGFAPARPHEEARR